MLLATPPRLLPAAFLKGAGGAAALAVIVSGSALVGFVAHNLISSIAQATGSASIQMMVQAGSLLVLGVAAVVVMLVTGTGRIPILRTPDPVATHRSYRAGRCGISRAARV